MDTINAWTDKTVALLERLDKWWNKTAKPQIVRVEKTPDYLAGRIIYCVECDKNSTLWRYRGRMVCSSCSSDAWHYPIPLFHFLYKDVNAQSKTGHN